MIDTARAVIVDVEATPARMAQEIKATKAMLDRVEEKHGIRPHRLAADKAYGTGPFLAWLSERNITPHIPVLDRQQQTGGLLPREAFSFDPERNVFICPQGKILKHRTAQKEKIHMYRATARDCKMCPIRQQCTRGPNAPCLCHSKRPFGRTLLPCRTPKPSKTHAACARRSKCSLPI